MRIHELPVEVVNQIAAGEVVERPAHLVKELIENALDAQATEIEIQIAKGGRSVLVRDNGSGIEKADLALSLQRHATSKITNALDLWNLNTFGFRGEALASIGAVSRMTITSRTGESDQAYRICSEYGALTPLEEVGGRPGTTVEVQDLFENVPARLRFLKSESAEVTQMKQILKAFGLRHPQVQFRLEVEGRQIYFWLRESAMNRVLRILDLKEAFYRRSDADEMQVEVYLAPPNVTTATQRNIWCFVQGRPVTDRMLQAAVMDAYRGLLMHGEFPIAVVMVQTAPEDVDVNVHPAKSQVKFLESSKVFRAVQKTVREALEPAPWIPAQRTSVMAPAEMSFSSQIPFVRESLDPAPSEIQDFQVQLEAPVENRLEMPAPPTAVAPHRWASLQLIGQSRLTYLVAQTSEHLILIDQHAAHERVLFEKLMRARAGGILDIQKYLIPLTLDLEPAECTAVLALEQELARFGIGIELLSPTCLTISSGPALLSDSALFKGLAQLAVDAAEHGQSFAIEKALSEVCATMACHSAVRAGQKLSLEQMHELLEAMDEFAFSSFCPHGRPVWIQWDFNQIERQFGRIS